LNDDEALLADRLSGFVDRLRSTTSRDEAIDQAIQHIRAVIPADIVTVVSIGRPAALAGMGASDVSVGDLKDSENSRLVAMLAQGAFTRADRSYVALAARLLGMRTELLRVLASEHALRDDADMQAAERTSLVDSLLKRQQLLDNLARIERSISQRIPLGDVLATITDAAHHLLGDEIVALRLLDPDDPTHLILVSDSGVAPELFNRVRRTAVGEGVGGRAVSENALVVVHDYHASDIALPPFAETGLIAAMAAPVHEGGVPVGSLTVASYAADRHYGPVEQETLLAFAEHVSLALADARTVEAMEAAQQSKRNLLAMVSHELKTPLTVMMGVVRTIQRHAEKLPEQLRDEMLTAAQERGHELEVLIDRLLQGAVGTAVNHVQEASLYAVISAAVAPYAGTRPLIVEPVPHQRLRVDVAKVQDVLSNLIDNAIAHSPAGTGIGIATRVDIGIVSITVRNDGSLPEGVAPSSLFSAFERGADAPSPGIGLGLFIASRLTTGIGGTLHVTTDERTVSFTLRFPALSDVAITEAEHRSPTDTRS
jgi:signal transduction histidine kinase